MNERVEVTSQHRAAAAELTLRTLDGETIPESGYRLFVEIVALELAKGKAVMLRRDGQGVSIKLFTR